MVWLICILILNKPGLINNYLVLLIFNSIVLFSNVSKNVIKISEKFFYMRSYLISLVFLIQFDTGPRQPSV